MEIDKKKLERQVLGVNKFLNSSVYGSHKDGVGTLYYGTGVGKTYTAFLIRDALLAKNENLHTVIIVPSENLLNQWNERLNEHYYKKDLISVEVYTAHYLVENNLRIHTDFLIVDELHEFYTDKRYELIDKTYIQYDYLLGLTATFYDSKNRHKRMETLCPIIDTISEQEAIEQGYISNYIEYNLGLTLDEVEQTNYDSFTEVISKNMPKFNGDLSLATKCLSGGMHNGQHYTGIQICSGWATHKGWRRNLNLNDIKDAEIDALWNPGKVMGYAKELMNAIRARKTLLYNSKSKVKATVELIQKYDKLKTIVFSQSTSFADLIGKHCNEAEKGCAVVYHSQLATQMLPSPSTNKLIKFGKVRLKRRALEKLRDGSSRAIITASSLDKGFDVEDIRLGITASGTQNFTQYIQRSGRVKRKEIFNPNVIVLIINLYIKDSKDYHWLIKRQSKSNSLIHWVNSVDEITFNPIPNDVFTIDDI